MTFECCNKCADRCIKEIDGKLRSCHTFCEKYQQAVKDKKEYDETIYQIKQRRKLDLDSYSTFRPKKRKGKYC